ncbi:hypothetical protein [Candidatus Villigracilis saccharophilus]|uniref:hypothetical protein n=1 Tax=Candidatus Villigracilis saccharophilus TaxID=3140684 RepID=UPI00313638D6|nr:hypothetical protein [Anaerolineales bacterium]
MMGLASPQPAKALPEIVVINEEEFNKRVAGTCEVDHQRIKRLRKLLMIRLDSKKYTMI